MKKTLLSLFALIAIAFGARATEATFDFVNNTYGMTRWSGNVPNYIENDSTITTPEIPGVSLLLSNSAAEPTNASGTRLWSDGLRFYKGSTVTISAEGITKLVFTCQKNVTNATFGLPEGAEGSLAFDGKTMTWTGSASSVKIMYLPTSSNAAVNSIAITYGEAGETKAAANLVFSPTELTATMGEEVTPPTLTKDTDAVVTYSSSNAEVATVDAATGALTLVGAGTAVITATAPETATFAAGSASYTLTVEAAVPENRVFFSEYGEDFTNIAVVNTDLTVWSADSRYKYLKGSAYSGGVQAAEAIAASPVIDLTGCSNIEFTYKQAFNQYKLNNVMIDVADFNGYAFIVVREEGATDWTQLATPTAPEAFNWNFYDNAPISLEAYAGKKIQIGFRYVSTADVAGTWEIKEISLTADHTGAVKSEPNLAFSPAELTATLGQEVTAPTLTKDTDAAVTYSSSNAEVATVDAATGALTLVGAGTAVITATAPETDTFLAGTASYTLTVNEPRPANEIYYSECGEDFTNIAVVNTELTVWKADTKYKYLKGSAYSGGVQAAEAIAASPVIDLTGLKNISFTYQQAFNQYKLNNVMIDVADFNGYAFIVVREEGAADWTQLATPTAPEAFNWNFYANEAISLEAYAGKKIQLGFRYVSTADVAGTWEVKEITVTADKDDSTAIMTVSADDADAPVEYYNLQGVRIAEPASGLYIRRQGNKVSKVIL